MDIYFHKSDKGNFGDDLNEWLWPKILPSHMINGSNNKDSILVGIGTILNNDIPHKPHKHVLGAGCGYGNLPTINKRWTIHWVRGPLTAEKISVDKKCCITDPAYLVTKYFEPSKAKKHEISFIPHHASLSLGLELKDPLWKYACNMSGINFIDPRDSVSTVLEQITSSNSILCEAMHGAIVADAFRVPWTPVKLHDHILNFKWDDWCRSMNLTYDPIIPNNIITSKSGDDLSLMKKFKRKVDPLCVSRFLAKIDTSVSSRLSDESVLDKKVSKMLSRINTFVTNHS